MAQNSIRFWNIFIIKKTLQIFTSEKIFYREINLIHLNYLYITIVKLKFKILQKLII